MSEPADLAEAVEHALRAPSVHNTQPWRWRVDAPSVHLYSDASRQLPNIDPDGRDLMLSCGAALHHCVVALAAVLAMSMALQVQVPKPAMAGTVPGTGCQAFPADNVWNTDVSSLPVHPRSADWLASTAAGVLFSNWLTNPRALGIDLLLPIFFATLLIPAWRGARRAVPWLVAGLVAAAVNGFVAGYWYIIAGAVSGAVSAGFIGDD